MERWLWGAVALLAVAVGGLFAYKYLLPQNDLPMVSAALPSCDVQQGACTAVIDNVGTITLLIAPRPIPLVEPLNFQVTADIPGVRQAEIDFSGVDMNMGYNRYRLNAVGQGRYEGEGMLPVCVRNRMTWEAKIMLSTGNITYVAPFRFDTISRR